MLWVILVLVIVVGFVFWVHYSRDMSVLDRINAAQDIIRSDNFTLAEGFDAAVSEDADLIGWLKHKHDCVMLFRTQEGPEVREVVDIASDSFHPGLVINYHNAVATKVDSAEIADPKIRSAAAELLRLVRQAMEAQLEPRREYDGFHY